MRAEPVTFPRGRGASPKGKEWDEYKGDFVKNGTKSKTPLKFEYYGIVDCAPKWEKLPEEWVDTNFVKRGYGNYLDQLKKNDGESLPVPKGSSAAAAGLGGGVSDFGGTGESASASAVVPSVTNQGDRPFCASYGLAGALRFSGYSEIAASLELNAVNVLESKTCQAAAAVQMLEKKGGWEKTKVYPPDFDPLASPPFPNPLIAVLEGSDGDKTHCVGMAGDGERNWIFNSNFHDKVLLTRENLDDCILGHETFKNVAYAVEFIPGKKLKRKRQSEI